jgi:hypothetical protein
MTEDVKDPDQGIKDAFTAAVEGGNTEDGVKMAMIGAGATFRNVTRLYNHYAIEAGLAMSREDREELVKNVLEDIDPSDEEGFSDAVDTIMENGAGVDESTAARSLRAYCKKNDIAFWVKPKGEGREGTGFTARYYNALVANPSMTKEQASDLINGRNGQEATSENVKRHETQYQAIRALANRIALAKEEQQAA